jgi:Tfp pilus assembly protein PilV
MAMPGAIATIIIAIGMTAMAEMVAAMVAGNRRNQENRCPDW